MQQLFTMDGSGIKYRFGIVYTSILAHVSSSLVSGAQLALSTFIYILLVSCIMKSSLITCGLMQ